MLLNSQTLVRYDHTLALFLCSWCRSSSIPQDWWAISTRGLCFFYFDTCPTKLLSVGKGGFEYHIWIETIPPVLYGRSFITLTDHRPLLTLFRPHQPIPAHSAARLQSRPLSWLHTTTTLSTGALLHILMQTARLPLPQTWSPKCEIVECYFLDSEVVTNVTIQMIKKETQVDPVLSKMYTYVISGWPGFVTGSYTCTLHEQTR